MNRPTSIAASWSSWRGWLARHVLLLAFLFLIPAFLVTRSLVGEYRATEDRLAVGWYEQGESDLKAGRLGAAIDDYRAALAYARDDPTYRLRLAQAQLRAGRLDAAAADLRRLWDDRPSDSVVNLELARLAARQGLVSEAVRYYTNAIYGQWSDDPADHQRETEMELADYLFRSGRTGDAHAWLIALAAIAPPDPSLHIALGDRLLRIGATAAAQEQFRAAIELDPTSPAAREGAGITAFHLGDYAGARRFLQLAVEAGNRDAETARMLAVAQDVLDMDPFARRLTPDERVDRVRAAFAHATASFGACVPALEGAGQAVLDEATAIHTRFARIAPLLGGRHARDAQLQQDAMDLVFDTEELVTARCGTRDAADTALLALARSRRGTP